jgi:thioredoxin reductase (NADPH)
MALHLDCATTVRARVVLAATGVNWRRLPAEGAARFEGAGVHYVCTAVEAVLYDGRDVAVIGGGNSAGQAAMHLAECCRERSVHLIVRSRLGASMSEYLVRRLRAAANVVIHEGAEVTAVEGGIHPETSILTGHDGATFRVSASALFVFIGADPSSAWLPAEVARDELGYVLTGADAARAGRWPLSSREPCPLETTVPRLLAAGDLRAGSTKRVGFAVGDGSLAVTCTHKLLSLSE